MRRIAIYAIIGVGLGFVFGINASRNWQWWAIMIGIAAIDVLWVIRSSHDN